MKDFDPLVFVSVFQEMLGLLFWPLVAFIVLGAVFLGVVLLRDGGVHSRRLVKAELVGLVGGVLAVGLMLWVTSSSLRDVLGGPVDWLLTLGIFIAGTIGATIAAYVALSLGRAKPTAHSRVFGR